jgi:cation diffusion facilitator CzcD-associated flavoprotein CzcO
METFKGLSFHPFDWPHDQPDLSGKRVAIIGTGATAIQIIPEVAKVAGRLTVFQRRPNWAAPLNNAKISKEEMAQIRARYDEIFAACARTPGGFEHEPDRRGFHDVTPAERRELWDRLYDGPGFGIWLQNFVEIFTEEAANAEFSAYIAERIRGRVNDKALAEKLIPKDHGFGIQRVPLETGYFETYNRDNVELVDSGETPIVEITRRRRDLLRELARTQSAVKAASPVPFPDRLRPALQATLDLIQRSVRLDRQNEQWMLRHQMIHGDLVPSSASRSPQRIRSTYGLRAGGIGP